MEEKLEFLKREEIRTMEKDIARLRELEAQKEREKISTIKIGEIPQKEIEPPAKEIKSPPEAQKKAAPFDSLTPNPPPKRKRALKKILVRGALIFFVILTLGVFLYFEIKNKIETTIIPRGEEATTTEEIIKPEELTLPQPQVLVNQTKIIEISRTEEIPQSFNQVSTEKIAEGSLARILIKNLNENRFLPLKEISLVFDSLLPEEILEKLENNYTLAIFGQKEGNRIVLAAKTKDSQGLIELLKKWEKNIVQKEISLQNQKFQPLSSSFKTAASQGTFFRYLTLAKNDFGICYLVLDDYFVLTSSFASMKKIIEELSLEKKLGQLIIAGFEGKTLTPELKEFFKKYKPGGLLLLSKNIESKEQLKTLISQLQALSQKETSLPLFVAVDQEGGPITRIGFLEEKTPQKEIENNEKAYQVGETRGQELKELGINLNLAPVLDWTVSGDFLFERSFQKPVETSGQLAKSLILGQKSAGVLTSIKHFPGYSGITFNPEGKLAEVQTIPEISQFKKAIEANPEFVMTSNVIYKEIDPSLPFSFSSRAIQLLKISLGENSLVVSDDLAQDSLIKQFSLKEVLTRPIEAGVDVLIFSGYKVPVEQGLDEFLKAFKSGEISKEKVEKAVKRIIQLKNKLK